MAYLGANYNNIITPVGVALGGTGAIDAAGARTNLSVPSIDEIQKGTQITLSSVSGTNTIVASAAPSITSYVAGHTFRFIAAGTNTGAVTINISGLGAKAITKSGAVALSAGDIPSGAVVQITYDGTRFQLVSGAGGGGGGAVADGTMYEAGTSVANNYTITAGKNALAVDKLSVASGKSVTIPTGSKLVVVGAGGQSGTPDQYVGVSGNQTIAGTKNFTSAPTLNGTDLTSIGVGQTWQNVTGSRAVSTTYTNTTGRPIWVRASFQCTSSATANGRYDASLYVNGVIVYTMHAYANISATGETSVFGIVPAGATYSVGNFTLANSTYVAWHELR